MSYTFILYHTRTCTYALILYTILKYEIIKSRYRSSTHIITIPGWRLLNTYDPISLFKMKLYASKLYVIKQHSWVNVTKWPKLQACLPYLIEDVLWSLPNNQFSTYADNQNAAVEPGSNPKFHYIFTILIDTQITFI